MPLIKIQLIISSHANDQLIPRCNILAASNQRDSRLFMRLIIEYKSRGSCKMWSRTRACVPNWVNVSVSYRNDPSVIWVSMRFVKYLKKKLLYRIKNTISRLPAFKNCSGTGFNTDYKISAFSTRIIPFLLTSSPHILSLDLISFKFGFLLYCHISSLFCCILSLYLPPGLTLSIKQYECWRLRHVSYLCSVYWVRITIMDIYVFRLTTGLNTVFTSCLVTWHTKDIKTSVDVSGEWIIGCIAFPNNVIWNANNHFQVLNSGRWVPF